MIFFEVGITNMVWINLGMTEGYVPFLVTLTWFDLDLVSKFIVSGAFLPFYLR